VTVLDIPPQSARDAVLCDGLLRHATGLRFRFTDRNPLTDGPYGASLWDDLPYCIGVLVRQELRVGPEEWDRRVAAGVTADVVGPGEYVVPLTVGLLPPYLRICVGLPGEVGALTPRGLLGLDALCPDCWGSGLQVDYDASMTGFRNALFLCCCMGQYA
jgi:hypothetical protein